MKPSGPWADDLELALQIADYADAITLGEFGPGHARLQVEMKDDATPVTEVDRTVEETIRGLLAKRRPKDSVLGEEFGTTGGGPRQWVIDPVDATKNYIRGIPVWATLIALLDEGKPVMGVVSAPAMRMRWFAAAGDGAWKGATLKDAVRLRVSPVNDASEATLSYSSLVGWEQRGLLDQFLELHHDLWRTRAFGDFWSYMLVAEGVVEIAAEPYLALYDMAALVPIVEEAGGRFTSITGVNGPFGNSAVATNGILHDEVLGRFRPSV